MADADKGREEESSSYESVTADEDEERPRDGEAVAGPNVSAPPPPPPPPPNPPNAPPALARFSGAAIPAGEKTHVNLLPVC